ncbi:MAG: hypothetical protein MK078_17575 [Crocinitomicaceae bacterium]|nr:hypothetical protein [Crocinitomicaceae bacterium]
MSIAEIFLTGERKQDISHFRNMVMIAKSDGVISEEEIELLHKIGRKIALSDEQTKAIIKKPEEYPITPPVSRIERFEQMVNLVQMVAADGKVEDAEFAILERIAVGIGYNDLDEVDVESILALIHRGEDTNTIIEELL